MITHAITSARTCGFLPHFAHPLGMLSDLVRVLGETINRFVFHGASFFHPIEAL